MIKSVAQRFLQRSNMRLQFVLVAMLMSSLISTCWGISNIYNHDVAPSPISLDAMRLLASVMKPVPLSNIEVLGVVLPSDDTNDSAPGDGIHNPAFDSSSDLPDMDTVLQNVEQLHNSLESSSDENLPSQTFIKIIRIDANLNDQLPYSVWNLPSMEASEKPTTATATHSTNSSKAPKPITPPRSKGVHYYKGSAYPPWSYGPPPLPAIREPIPDKHINPNE